MKHINTIKQPPYIIYVYSDNDRYSYIVKDYDGILLENAYGYESQEQAERDAKDRWL